MESMSQQSKFEYINIMKYRYLRSGKQAKTLILDEVCTNCGYERKYAIKVLRGTRKLSGGTRGRKKKYSSIIEPLQQIWLAANLPCGKLLKASLPLWLEHYQFHFEPLNELERDLLLTVSAAQIDRLLAPTRIKYAKRKRSTKPGSLLCKEIPFAVDCPNDRGTCGHLEVDTVAHCGGSMRGSFVNSVTFTDIKTQWTIVRAIWSKNAHAVTSLMDEVCASFPFAIKSVDFDNGSEFINEEFVGYCRRNGFDLMRSRPYKKNDNAHVEQKNWTHVRELLGYERFDDPSLVGELNELYRDYWNPYQNYFCAKMKLVGKTRIGSKYQKTYDTPQTPYERASSELPELNKPELDPFELKKCIDKKLKTINAILQKKRAAPSLGMGLD